MGKFGFNIIPPFKPTVFEDLGPRPILIESKEQLRRICRKKGLGSVLLENDTTPRSRHKREGYSRWKYNRKTGKLVRIA